MDFPPDASTVVLHPRRQGREGRQGLRARLRRQGHGHHGGVQDGVGYLPGATVEMFLLGMFRGFLRWGYP